MLVLGGFFFTKTSVRSGLINTLTAKIETKPESSNFGETRVINSGFVS